MKVCTNCKTGKEATDFYKNSTLRGGFSRKCKECHKKTCREWDKNNKDRRDIICKISRLKTQYGMTYEQYKEMLEEQDYRCLICGKKQGDEDLCVDHNHKCCPTIYSCGKCVRGLICRPCNSGLGHFKDDAQLMQKAIEYLKVNDISNVTAI